MSKGSWYRPHDKEKFDAGWDRIFSKKEDEKEAIERCIDYEEYEMFEDEPEEHDWKLISSLDELERDEEEGC